MHTLNQHHSGGTSFEERTESTSTSHNGAVNGLKFNSDGLFLISTGTDARMRLWDVFYHKNTLVNYGKVKNPLHRTVFFAVTAQTDPAIVFVPHGSMQPLSFPLLISVTMLFELLFRAALDRIRMCEMLTGDEVNVLSAHFAEVTGCVLHPIRQEIYSTGSNGEILAWAPLLKSRVVENQQEVLLALFAPLTPLPSPQYARLPNIHDLTLTRNRTRP